jgi:hypothetical protein
MQNERKKSSRGLIIALAIPYILFLVFFICLLVFGAMATKCADPDIKGGLGDVLKFHFSGMGGLFSFNFHEGSNVVYFSLSGILYFFIFIAILYLIVGIWVIYKKKRMIVVPAIVASLIAVLIFMLVATGLPKYWAIINNRPPFDTKNNLVGASFAILIFGIISILAAFISYFVSLVEAYKNPGVLEGNKQGKKASGKDDEYVEFEEYLPEPEPEPEPARIPQEKSAPAQAEKAPEDKSDLKSLLKEVVRDIVRDEIARNNANQPKSDFNAASGGSVTGATFGGPLVVQYFNGGIQGATPVSQPAPEPVKEEKKEEPQPVVEEPVQEPEPEPIPEPSPVPESEPVVEEAPVVEEPVQEEPAPVEEPQPEPVVEEVVAPVEEPAPVAEEKKPIIRIPFTERMLNADKEMQDNYNELKNEILSYGVNSRVSNSGDAFRLHRKTYVKLTIAGLSLKLYFALNPEDYKDSPIPVQDAGHKGIYAEIPLVFKVKSGLSMRRCKELIQTVMEKDGLEQGPIGDTDWVEKLKEQPVDENPEED